MAEEKEEIEKLDELENQITATREIFIPKDQQHTLQLDGNTVISEELRLTQGDVAPCKVDQSVVSALTGDT